MFGYSEETLKKENQKRKRKKIIIISICTAIAVAVAGATAYYINVYSKPYGKYNLDKYIKVGKYKNLDVDELDIDISKRDVRKEIQKEIESSADIKEKKSGKVNNGDTVNIDYEGTIDGESYKGGTGKAVSLTIGSGSFVDGFESSLIGKEVGDEVTVKTTFPDDYSDSELAGKDVKFKVVINSKENVDIPKYTTDWVEENTKYDSKEEYEKAVKKRLYNKEKKEARLEQKEKLWDDVVDSSKVKKYPEEECERIKEATISLYKMYAKQYKMKYSDFLEKQMQMDEKQFEKQLESFAKDEVKQEMVAYWIAKKEKIKVSEDEYNKFVKDVLEDYGYTKESFEEEFDKSYEDFAGRTSIYSEIYKDKVKDFIYKHAK